MTSHVDEAVAARIAAAKMKAASKRQQREEFDAGRRTGLQARHRARAKRMGVRLGFCASCARPLTRGTYLLCSKGCGAKVCRGHTRCASDHNPQCPSRATTYTDSPQEVRHA